MGDAVRAVALAMTPADTRRWAAAHFAGIATGIREDEDHDGLSIPHDHPERPPHPLARPHDAPFR